jgi:hypothetical protein
MNSLHFDYNYACPSATETKKQKDVNSAMLQAHCSLFQLRRVRNNVSFFLAAISKNVIN